MAHTSFYSLFTTLVCFWHRWLVRGEKHTLHTLLPGAMQSGTYCTPECPFTHDDGFVRWKNLSRRSIADIVCVLCSRAHKSLMVLFRKHPFVPTIANICVIYTTKEPGVWLPGLEQHHSAFQHTNKKLIY